MFCLHVCLCSTYRLDAQAGQEKALDTLELKLWMVVSHHNLGTKPGTCAGKSALTRRDTSPAP